MKTAEQQIVDEIRAMVKSLPIEQQVTVERVYAVIKILEAFDRSATVLAISLRGAELAAEA